MNTKRITLGIMAAIAFIGLAFTSPAVKKAAVTYAADVKSSKIVWVGKKVTGEHKGNISLKSGSLLVDGKAIKSGSFEMDMNSITNTDLTDKEYNAKLIGHLKSDDFFGVATNPVAKFEITKAELKEGANYNITGKLTIKGITNEITFPATVTIQPKTLTATAKILVNRTKFNIKYGSGSFFDNLGDKAINDDFELNIDLVANSK